MLRRAQHEREMKFKFFNLFHARSLGIKIKQLEHLWNIGGYYFV